VLVEVQHQLAKNFMCVKKELLAIFTMTLEFLGISTCGVCAEYLIPTEGIQFHGIHFPIVGFKNPSRFVAKFGVRS
jgi:hypothetical protein